MNCSEKTFTQCKESPDCVYSKGTCKERKNKFIGRKPRQKKVRSPLSPSIPPIRNTPTPVRYHNQQRLTDSTLKTASLREKGSPLKTASLRERASSSPLKRVSSSPLKRVSSSPLKRVSSLKVTSPLKNQVNEINQIVDQLFIETLSPPAASPRTVAAATDTTVKCVANIKPGIKCSRVVSDDIGCNRLCWEHAKIFAELGWPGAYWYPESQKNVTQPAFVWEDNKWVSNNKRCSDPNIIQNNPDLDWAKYKNGVFQETYDTAWNSDREYMQSMKNTKQEPTITNIKYNTSNSTNNHQIIVTKTPNQTVFVNITKVLFDKLRLHFTFIEETSKDTDTKYKYPSHLPISHLYIILDYYTNLVNGRYDLNDYYTMLETLRILGCTDQKLIKFIKKQIGDKSIPITIKFTGGGPDLVTVFTDRAVQDNPLLKEMVSTSESSTSIKINLSRSIFDKIQKIRSDLRITPNMLTSNQLVLNQIIVGWSLLKLNMLELLEIFRDEIIVHKNKEFLYELQDVPQCSLLKPLIIAITPNTNHKDFIQRRLRNRYFESVGSFSTFDHNRYNLSSRGNELLGEGTFGRVLKVIDNKTKQVVAIKELKNVIKDANSEHYLLNEINLLTELCGHPYVVKLLDVAISKENKDTKIYLIFEYQKYDLKKYITEKKTLEYFEIQKFAYQLLSGIKWLHSNKIVHRDLKPANLLYDQKNARLQITDFGASKRFNVKERLTENDYVTLGYRAPELYFKDVDLSLSTTHSFAVDLWSAGVIILELLTPKGGYLFFPTQKEIEAYIQKYPKLREKKRDEMPWNDIYTILSKQLIKTKVYNNDTKKVSRTKIGHYLKTLTHIHPNIIQPDQEALLDLLKGLLEINPKDRISVDQALNSPVFKDVHNTTNFNSQMCFAEKCNKPLPPDIAKALDLMQKTVNAPVVVALDPRRRKK